MMHGMSRALDESVEVERLVVARDVLGRDDRALDDEDVEAAGKRGLEVALAVLRGERGRGKHATVLDLPDALRDELGLDGLLVDLLHLEGRLFLVEGSDLSRCGAGSS